MSDYYFRTSDLTVGYDDNPIVEDVNISLHQGEILTIIGPNGAGKSTILKSITGHLKAISGDSYIAEIPVSSMSYDELAKKLSVVLTDKIKGDMMTCYDVVATGRYPYTGMLGILSEEDKRIVSCAMERVNTSDIADRDFTAISDGQRQRILLARAICQDTDVIVLDEPTSYLDIRHKMELLSLLHSMAKDDGITVIMSLHEIDLAQKISDKIMCVSGGRIMKYGTPEEIFRYETIKELYGIQSGSYDALFGSVELPAPEGAPEVFVISACGRGVPIYRKLQRKGIPFCAGILYTNDVDYRLAKHLAAEVVSAEPFAPMSEDALERAEKSMDRCRRVINAGFPDGPLADKLHALVEKARRDGKLDNDVSVSGNQHV
ncbi:MAG: ABC transporter ATP-binding protein [Eubacterium sp.]|jgi:iron complex transport system ATP-binding protein